jgi:predicted peptidase
LILKSKENAIDSIYLTGLSICWGAWNLAFAHPEMFAALVPIAFVDRVPMIENCKIATIPIRIFTV